MSNEKGWAENNPITFALIVMFITIVLSTVGGIISGVTVNRIEYQEQHQRDLLQDSNLLRLYDSLNLVRDYLKDSMKIVNPPLPLP